jgi:IS5 family transposase
MDQRHLGDQLFHRVNVYLAENGMKLSRGTLVDATIISAPSSTKNKKIDVILLCAKHGKEIDCTSG